MTGKQIFDAAVAALWNELGLAPKRPRIDARATLTVEGRDVALALGPDERSLVVAAEIGTLSLDLPEAAEQMRRVLRDGCGLIRDRRAALRLRPGRDDRSPAVAEIQAVAPCDARDARALIEAIEDVLFLADVHAPTLASGASRRSAAALSPLDFEGSLIFRP